MCVYKLSMLVATSCTLGENMLAFLQARKKKPSVRRPGEEALVRQTDAMEWDSREDVTMETKIDAKMDAKVDDAMKEKARSKL